ncbi:MHS family MFS transporter [Fodinisporobacter ferrooxydans]|uniref:MHS family MFS transporter n=1 Tax=Fodinisporobacter ferrooxydans TaxID=2901836 RepID=A0ABY4CF07_9BACL|nr:MHS family MFS transporter [Alicyclobacillaceae bacterium MYW30-H2]
MAQNMSAAQISEHDYRSQVRKAAIASLIGTAIEWYDFFLYGTIAALVFPKLFFPTSDPYVGFLETFAIYALGFVARPVGGAIFGHYGDRIGRKATLIITLLLMGISSTLIGLMPTYNSIGSLAPWLLTLLRVLQGIGVGGEWGGSVLLSLEWGHKEKRGLMGSWPQLGVPLGLALSSALVSIFLAVGGKEGFVSWGWRIPFILSIVLVAIGLFIRLRIMETPLFSKVIAEKRVERTPVSEVIKNNWKEILLSALLRMSEQTPFYIFITFVISYGTGTLHLSGNFLNNSVLAAAFLSLFSIPFFGYLSDRIGRKRMYIIGSALTLIYAFPYFGMLDTKVPALVVLAIVVSLIPHDMQYGPQAALIAENFPTRLRYSGASLGYQLASVIAGGPAPLVAAWLLHTFGSSNAIAGYIVICSVITIIATSLLKDRTKVDIIQEFNEGVSV